MSNTPRTSSGRYEKPPEGKTWRQVLDEHLAGPVPYLTAEEIVRMKAEKAERARQEARQANRKVLELTPHGGPQGRRWRPWIDKVSAYSAYEPTALDRIAEVREAVARAAREA